MTLSNHYSVVVVGGGPTGLVLANLLGKAGLRTMLIEANASTVTEPRAVSIDDETLRVVQGMGLLDVVQSEIVQGYGSEYRCPRGRVFLRVKPVAQPYGHPRRNAFRQPIFEAQLREGLLRYPTVETRFLTRVERFVQGPDGVVVEARTSDDQLLTFFADYMIGCDGASSAIREALGYKLSGSSLDERWLIIDLEDSPTPSPETIVYCDPARPGISLPGPRQTRRYEFKLSPKEQNSDLLNDAVVAKLLAAGEAAAGSRLVRKTVYHFHARVADHWGRGRVWLAGDAAHLMPPFAGQGMNSGVRDAANLAWKIREVVSGRIGPKLLETYERERRGHVRDMIGLALRMGAIFGPRSELHGLWTRVFFRLLGLWPAARSYFAEMKYKPAPRISDGFVLKSMVTKRGVVGRMLPQPLLPASCGAGLLDDLLGDGFTLLGIGLETASIEAIFLGPRWEKLIDRRIGLPTAAVPTLAKHEGYLLLLRPDRYVLARFVPEQRDSVVQMLDALLEATWGAVE